MQSKAWQEGLKRNLTAARLKRLIQRGGFQSKTLKQSHIIDWKCKQIQESCLLPPVSAVSMYCVSSIYLFSIFNGRIPQLLSAPGGNEDFICHPVFSSLDIQWMLYPPILHTFACHVSVSDQVSLSFPKCWSKIVDACMSVVATAFKWAYHPNHHHRIGR